MSNNWKSWAIVGSKTTPGLHEEILAIPGMVDGRDLPIFYGSLGDFQRVFKKQFLVSSTGLYIKVGGNL